MFFIYQTKLQRHVTEGSKRLGFPLRRRKSRVLNFMAPHHLSKKTLVGHKNLKAYIQGVGMVTVV